MAADDAAIVRLDAALLAVAHFLASREVREAIAADGVAPQHRALFTALRAIRDLPAPVSIKDVQREIGLSHPATCRVIDRCVAEDLVERRESGQDRRMAMLVLTRAGRGAIASVEAARQAVVATLVAEWSAAERIALLEQLERLLPEFAGFRAAAGS